MIRVYTFADKRPDFIPLQAACIEQFFPKGTIFTVFNNGSSLQNSNKIISAVTDLCFNQLGTCYFGLPPEAMDHSNPNAACAVPLNWAWQNVILKTHDKEDTVIILDSDMFVVAPFDPVKYMGESVVAGTKQKRGKAKYIWNGLMIFRRSTPEVLKQYNFNYGEVEGSLTDVGGHTHHWLKQIDAPGCIKNIHHTSHIHPDNKNMHCIPEKLREFYDPEFRMEIYAECFLHYGRGSNWDNMPADYHERKTQFLKMAISNAIAAFQNGRTIFEPHGYIFSENEWEKP